MLAVIGGTGVDKFPGLELERRQVVQTPYGLPSSPLLYGRYQGKQVVFLARHGSSHSIPPHQINYRANIWALQKIGVQRIFSLAAVGAINAEMKNADLVIPDQLIDYTWGRQHTFFEAPDKPVTHIDFSQPYCPEFSADLLRVAKDNHIVAHPQAVYAVTQGPRLETSAEINRLERDGCDIVGMTAMPEAVLAKELGLCYASCAIIANPAAGRGDGESIDMEAIEAYVAQGLSQAQALLVAYLAQSDNG